MSAINESERGDHSVAGPGQGIVRDPETCAGDPILAGTRTAVHDIVSYFELYDRNLARVQAEALPHLTLTQLQVAIDWYSGHRAEIDQILDERRRYNERAIGGRVTSIWHSRHSSRATLRKSP